MKRLFALGFGTCAFILAPTMAAAQPSDSLARASTGAAAPNDRTPLDPASLALARQILTIAFPPAKRPQMYGAIMQSIVDQSMRNMGNSGAVRDKDFQAILDRSTRRMFDQLTEAMIAALPDYFESMARAYARDLSRDDLTAVLAFVKTPAGQHYFERSPLILKDPDVQAAGQRMMAKVMEKAPEIERENRQELDAYLARTRK